MVSLQAVKADRTQSKKEQLGYRYPVKMLNSLTLFGTSLLLYSRKWVEGEEEDEEEEEEIQSSLPGCAELWRELVEVTAVVFEASAEEFRRVEIAVGVEAEEEAEEEAQMEAEAATRDRRPEISVRDSILFYFSLPLNLNG